MGKQFSLKPLEDRVAVKASEGDETTASGIVIPDTAKERPQEGEVSPRRLANWGISSVDPGLDDPAVL